MSKYGHCKKGGMEGICVTSQELQNASRFFEQKWADAVIPLPGISPGDQKARLNHCIRDHAGMSGAQYWETSSGSHGWCCPFCGKTLQWG